MAQLFANVGLDFLFPKLHGMWADAVRGDALLALIQHGNSQMLGRKLHDLGIDVANRAEVQKKLTQRLLADLGRIRELLDPATGGFYDVFLHRYFIDNLKTALHYRYFPDPSMDLQFLLIEAPALTSIDAKAIMEAKTVHRLHRAIPETDVAAGLLPILAELDDSKDIFTAECRLDAIYYARLTECAARVLRPVRALLRQLVRGEIDTLNLVTILRNAELYRMPEDRVRSLCMSGGTLLESGALDALFGLEQREELVAALPAGYRKLLLRLVGSPLYVCENALWNSLYDTAQTAFRDYNRPALSVAAFPYLKMFEALNLGRAFEGFHFGLSSDEMRSMMIGVGRNV